MMTNLLLCISLSTFAAFDEPTPLPAPQVSAEHAARLYRITLYETFRTDRNEYQRRREMGDRVWNRFAASGYPAEHKAAVVEWFTAAQNATQQGRAILPPLPEFMSDAPATQVVDTVVPVSTSMPLEKVRIDVPPRGAITHMEITLPPQAVQTGPTQVLGSLIRQTFKAVSISNESDNVTSPPKASTDFEPVLTPPVITLPPQADQVYPDLPPVDATKIQSAKTEPASKVVPAVKLAPVAKPAPETFNFDELFAPATTPSPAPPVTSSDPFAP